MNRKKVFLISLCFFLLFITCFTYYFLSKRNTDRTDIKNVFYSKIGETFLASFNTDAYQYLDKNYLAKSSDITLITNIEQFGTNEDIEGLSLTTKILKNADFSHSITDIRASYRGLQLISGRLEIEKDMVKLYSPSIYSKVIVSNREFIERNVGIIYYNNIIYKLISEFIEHDPDKLKIISQNICVTYNNGYDFTIKAEAVKTFLSLLSEYIFEGQISNKLISSYITSDYYSNPNNSNYYTLEEYKEQFLEINKPKIQSLFFVASDLINFDVTIHFEANSKGKITSITYNDGNNDISANVDISITPYNQTHNINGIIEFVLADNKFNLNLNQLNSKVDSILSTLRTIHCTLNDKDLFTFESKSDLDCNKQTQNISFGFYRKDYNILIDCNAKYNSYKGEIYTIDEEECFLWEMNLFELHSLYEEIKNNLNQLKERLN